MCGIAGLFNISGSLSPAEMRQLAARMAGEMAYRGPDDQGVWVSGDGMCALSHRRLSIIDTSAAGHQPMLSADGAHALTFNGELYNFRELREQLEAAGECFVGGSDTEVMLAGLRRGGVDFLTHMDAMFAIGWYDSERRELLLARDAFGEKPLYYTFQNGLLAFASELHALTLIPGFDASITQDTIASYLIFQHVPAPATIYAKCRKLLPGCYMRVSPTGIGDPVRYHHFITAGDHLAKATLAEQADALEEILLRSLRRRLISDVPLGAFLSGGVDSSTAVALMTKRLNRSTSTFSVGFRGLPDSEHHEARQGAELLGTDHHEQLIDPADYGTFADLAGRMDEPNSDSSCVPTYAISALARSRVTVAITGDGGDEMFGGYNRYFDCMAAAEGRDADMAARRWHLGRDYFSHRFLVFVDRQIAGLFGSVPPATADYLLERRRRLDMDTRPILNRLREADVDCYLPVVLAKVDRMSMLNSLECRTPYLSPEVAAFAAALPQEHLHQGRRGKLVLRRVAERLLPKEWLERPKRGFGVDPLHDAARQAVIARLKGLVDDPECRLCQFMARDTVLDHVHRHFPSWGFYNAWAFLVLELWLRQHPHKAA